MQNGLSGWFAALLLALAVGLPIRSHSAPVLIGTVVKIIDGDTLDVALSSGLIRVRLNGIDAPERGQPGGRESAAALAELTQGHRVQLEPFQQDRYARLVATLYIGEKEVNAELVKQGH